MDEKKQPLGNAEWSVIEGRITAALLGGQPEVTQERVRAGRYATTAEAITLAANVATYLTHCWDSNRTASVLRRFAMHFLMLALFSEDESPAGQSQNWRACARLIMDTARHHNPVWCGVLRRQFAEFPLEHGSVFDTKKSKKQPMRLEAQERARILGPEDEYTQALAALARVAAYRQATHHNKPEYRECCERAAILAQMVADLAAGSARHVWHLAAHVRCTLMASRPKAGRERKKHEKLTGELARIVLRDGLKLAVL